MTLTYSSQGETGFIELNDEAKDTLYHDCPPDVADATFKTLLDHSLLALIEPTAEVYLANPSFEGCRGYIFCKHDRVISPALQREMLDTCGMAWDVKEMDTGHSPFLATPDALADVVEGFVGEFQAKQTST